MKGGKVAGCLATIAALTIGQSDASEWVQQNSGTTQQLTAVHFADAQTGYAAGFLTVLKTVDGGTNWQPVNLPANATFLSVFAKSASDVFVARQDLYRSTDGGSTWLLVSPGGSSVFDIKFCSDATGYMVRGSFISKTLDGGNTWNLVDSAGVAFSRIALADPQTIYAVGGTGGEGMSFGWLVRSFDGGTNWQKIQPFGLPQLTASAWTSSRHGFVFTATGNILETSDGGDSWVTNTVAIGDLVTDAAFIDGRTGFAVCAGGLILSTTDTGAHWTSSVVDGALAALACPCGGAAYYTVGNKGVIFKRAGTPDVEPLVITTLNYDAVGSAAKLHIHSSPGRRYRVEVSPDLSIWAPLAERVPYMEDWEFDIDTTGQTASFYRVVDVGP